MVAAVAAVAGKLTTILSFSVSRNCGSPFLGHCVSLLCFAVEVAVAVAVEVEVAVGKLNQ